MRTMRAHCKWNVKKERMCCYCLENILWQNSFYFQCVYEQQQQQQEIKTYTNIHWSEMIREIKGELKKSAVEKKESGI